MRDCTSEILLKTFLNFLRGVHEGGRDTVLQEDFPSIIFPPGEKKTASFQMGPSSSAVTAAASLQSCPTLCDPRDGSPPVSPVPGILQARTLEWVALLLPLIKMSLVLQLSTPFPLMWPLHPGCSVLFFRLSNCVNAQDFCVSLLSTG